MPPSFFALPGEIRNKIYSLVIPTRQTLLLSKPQPQLALVNRQLHAEVLAAYYAQNTFVLPLATRRLETHLLRLGFGNSDACVLRHLRSIDVFVERGWLVERMVREKRAIGLLHLNIRIAWDGESFEVGSVAVAGGEIREAVGRVMQRDEGVYTGMSLLKFVLEMRPSLCGKGRC